MPTCRTFQKCPQCSPSHALAKSPTFPSPGVDRETSFCLLLPFPYNIRPLIKGSADPREGLEGATAPAMPQTRCSNQKEKSQPSAFGDEDYWRKMGARCVHLQKGHRVDTDLD